MYQETQYHHILTTEPEYLSMFEVMLTPGFRILMSLIWIPAIIIFVLVYKFNKRLKYGKKK